jgi:hypothetical protein
VTITTEQRAENGRLSRNRGRTRELDVIAYYEARECVAYRLATGPADVIVLAHGYPPVLVQVKSTTGGPYERFGPVARRALLRDAIALGGEAVLAWWPPGATLRLITSDTWPR